MELNFLMQPSILHISSKYAETFPNVRYSALP